MAIVIDESKPCDAAAALRAIYTNLVAGQGAQIITFRAGPSGVERSVTYHKADPGRLLQVIREFESKCAAANGDRPRRYAMRAGGM